MLPDSGKVIGFRASNDIVTTEAEKEERRQEVYHPRTGYEAVKCPTTTTTEATEFYGKFNVGLKCRKGMGLGAKVDMKFWEPLLSYLPDDDGDSVDDGQPLAPPHRNATIRDGGDPAVLLQE